MTTLITRAEIAGMLEIKLKCLIQLIYEKEIGMPEPVSKRHNTLFYQKDQIDAWIVTNPLSKINLSVVSNAIYSPRLDNKMAFLFLTSPPLTIDTLSMSDIVKKQIKSERPKTTVVHLYDRNDVDCPHSALTPQYRDRSINYG